MMMAVTAMMLKMIMVMMTIRTCLPVRASSYAPSPPKTPQADKWQIFHNFNDFVFCVSSSFQVMNEEAKGKYRKLNTTKQRTAVFDIDY